MTIGDRLRMLRKEAGLTQKELGEKLGVSASMIGQYEKNLRSPKFETLQKIASVLNVDIAKLVDFSEISPSLNTIIPLISDFSDILKKPRSDDGKIHLSESERAQIRELATLIGNLKGEILNSSFLSEKLREECIVLFDGLNLHGKIYAIQVLETLCNNPELQAK